MAEERKVILDEFNKKDSEYVGELILESLNELFYDEDKEIESFSWNIQVTLQLKESK